jgi:glycine oxidase
MTMTSVLIIGGGVIGCAVAFSLAQRGYKVTVLEQSRIEAGAAHGRGPEASTAAAGILGAQIEGLRGDGPLTQLCLESRALYPAWESTIRERTGCDVELRLVGVITVAFSAAQRAALEAQVAWQERADLRVERLDAAAAAALEPSLSREVFGGVWFPEDARVDPPSLLAALRLAAEQAGVALRAEAFVRRVLIRSGRAAGVVLSDGTTIEGDAVVVSAGSWSSLIGETSLPDDAIAPARGQIIELKLPAPVLHGVVEGPDCYLSPRDDGRVLVGSTIELVGFRPGATATAIRDLLTAAIRLLPALGDATLSRAWAGFRPRSTDERPLIGTVGIEGLFVATGHYRNGVLLAPITGEIVASLIAGAPPPFDLSPFDPRRPMVPATPPLPRG